MEVGGAMAVLFAKLYLQFKSYADYAYHHLFGAPIFYSLTMSNK